MELTKNERMILNLLDFENYLEAVKLAQVLFVSDKTVRRSIKKLNQKSLEKYDKNIILSKAGKGFILNKYFKDKNIYWDFEDVDQFEEGSFLAIDDIILTLLFSYPKKHHQKVLNNDYLSASVRHKKVQQIRSVLKLYHIDLFQKRDFVWIEGTENNIRKAIRALTQQKNLSRIRMDLFPQDRYFIDKQIDLIEERNQAFLNYPYDLTIAAHLYMLIKRAREGKIQLMDPSDIQFEKSLIVKNPDIEDLAKLIIHNLEAYLNVHLGQSEVYYLFETLYVIRLNRRESRKRDKALADIVTKTLITRYFDISDVTLLDQSRQLYDDLYHHILPMLSRLQIGMTIENNLLEEVKYQYAQTFTRLKKIVNGINKELAFSTDIDESEISYLTLYFEKYNLEIKREQRVLLICTSGVGTSQLLKARLQSNIPSIDVIATMSKRQVDKNISFIRQNVDFILSTVHTSFNNIGDIPIITISSLLTKTDIQKIHYAMEKKEVG